MNVTFPLLGLYLLSGVVLALGLVTTATGRMPEFLLTSASLPPPTKVRLSGLELILLGLLMLLTSLFYGGEEHSVRTLLVLLTWIGFSIVMLILRLLSRRVDRLEPHSMKARIPA